MCARGAKLALRPEGRPPQRLGELTKQGGVVGHGHDGGEGREQPRHAAIDPGIDDAVARFEGVLTDATSRRIIAEDVAPLFRQNQYAAALSLYDQAMQAMPANIQRCQRRSTIRRMPLGPLGNTSNSPESERARSSWSLASLSKRSAAWPATRPRGSPTRSARTRPRAWAWSAWASRQASRVGYFALNASLNCLLAAEAGIAAGQATREQRQKGQQRRRMQEEDRHAQQHREQLRQDARLAHRQHAARFAEHARHHGRSDMADMEDPARVAAQVFRDCGFHVRPGNELRVHRLLQHPVVEEARSPIRVRRHLDQPDKPALRIERLREPSRIIEHWRDRRGAGHGAP